VKKIKEMKGETMVKIITERHVKKGKQEEYIQLIREFHPIAKQQQGYITADPLVSAEDPSIFLVVSTWEKPEDWKAFVNSEMGRKLFELTSPLLKEKPKSTVYHIVPLYE
jgi:quinol monooxygenase YgiN